MVTNYETEIRIANTARRFDHAMPTAVSTRAKKQRCESQHTRLFAEKERKKRKGQEEKKQERKNHGDSRKRDTGGLHDHKDKTKHNRQPATSNTAAAESLPNKLAAQTFGAVGCSRLRAESTSWSDRGTLVDPTHPLALTLTLTPTLTPTRTPNGPETGEKRGCAAFGFFVLSLRSVAHHIALGQ